MHRYPNVFSPIQLGPVEIPNRFYFAPHGVSLSAGMKPSTDFVEYTTARVRGGGCGLVIHSLTVHPRGTVNRATPHPEENVASFQAMADAVHAAGGRVFGEIWYQWIGAGFWQPLSPPAPPLGPSAVPYEFEGVARSTHEMTKAEIREMVQAFRQSSENLGRAGYDGVVLHAAHGALLEQFVSPYFNHRTDEYGGSLENRLRFLEECLGAAREGAGSAVAVGMRFNCDELLPGGYDQGEAFEILDRVCATGLVDFVDLDVAIEPQQLHLGMPPVFVEPQVYRPYVEALRSATHGVPVLSVLGRLTSVADGEAALASGACDVVGAARALIAEPRLVQLAREGEEHRGRVCIACNWCMESRIHGAAGCTINPTSFRERHWTEDRLAPAVHPTGVVVVGGGPAGLEAARVSALRGHRVVLLESRDRLGGGLAMWADLPGREWVRQSIEWWARELDVLGVDVRCGVEADVAAILAEEPGAVIVAAGSRYSASGRSAHADRPIEGSDQDFVFTPEDILVGGCRPSGRIVLLDAEGQHTGCGIGEMLASSGAEVLYISPSFAPVSARLAASLEFGLVVSRLKQAGVKLVPASYIRRIGRGAVTTYDVFSGEEATIDDVDAVILSTSRLPVDHLSRALEGRVDQLYTVGDALAVRLLAAAAYEGHKFARYIGEPDAPKTVGEAYFMEDPKDLLPQAAG